MILALLIAGICPAPYPAGFDCSHFTATTIQTKTTSAQTDAPYSKAEWRALQKRFREGAPGAYKEMCIAGVPAIPWLVEVMHDPQSGTAQFMAANALGEIGAPECVKPLLKGLEHSWFNVRRCAAGALGRIGDPAVIPRLKKLSENDPFFYENPETGVRDPLVRNAAAAAIEAILGAKEIFLDDPTEMPPSHAPDFEDKLPWPFPGDFAAQKLHNNYQQATDRYIHAALDLMLPAGTEVKAVEAGTVAFVSTNYPEWTTHHFFVVEPKAGTGEGWCYTHVDPDSYTFKVGDSIQAGTVLGKVVEFSLGERKGADHLHLNYVAFAQQADGSFELTPLYDPLVRFDWKDSQAPKIGPLWIQTVGTKQPLLVGEEPPTVSGPVQLFAGVSDAGGKGLGGNWGVAVMTLEIRGETGKPWNKLILDQRGPIRDPRQSQALYVPFERRKEMLNGLALPFGTFIVKATQTDGDGVIETSDEKFVWQTDQKVARATWGGKEKEMGIPRFPDGPYEVTLRAWDLAGNFGHATFTVNVKNAP